MSKHKRTEPDFDALARWDGREITVGTSAHYRVTPGLAGPAVNNFKQLMGVCMSDGCTKINGHDGLCS